VYILIKIIPIPKRYDYESKVQIEQCLVILQTAPYLKQINSKQKLIRRKQRELEKWQSEISPE